MRRGLIHFHTVFRLDGHDLVHPERTVPPHPAFTAEVLGEDHPAGGEHATWFATVSSTPRSPEGGTLPRGAQIDHASSGSLDDGEVTDTKVAAYLAGYATKSTEPVGVLPGRITAKNASLYSRPGQP